MLGRIMRLACLRRPESCLAHRRETSIQDRTSCLKYKNKHLSGHKICHKTFARVDEDAYHTKRKGAMGGCSWWL